MIVTQHAMKESGGIYLSDARYQTTEMPRRGRLQAPDESGNWHGLRTTARVLYAGDAGQKAQSGSMQETDE